MKSLTKAIAVASLASVSVAATAVEGLSTTIGAVSDYNFRGVALGDAGATVSVDYEMDGFYAGVWAIDDGTAPDGTGNAAGENGLEYDIYLGYNGKVEDFEYGIGYTRYDYTYTSDFEHEINLSGSIQGFGLDIAIGVDDDDVDEQDYTVIDLSYANGPYGILLGMVDRDAFDKANTGEASWNRVELSYSAEMGGADVSATYGRTFDLEVDNVDITSFASDYLVFAVSKSFDL